ncbi:MAG: zinc-ribbon domain-containing protein [Alphaproteobacteria bacterium]|nr:zinc-ribbon domain-containing protein [Alphaproteobacteria bacterium]
MILTCPQCQSQYNLDPGKLGDGRTVRCVSCSHTWFQPSAEREAASKQDDAVFEAILSEVGDSTAPRTKEADGTTQVLRHISSAPVITYNPLGVGARAFGWLTFFLWTSLTLLFLFFAQNPVVRHWPSMALLYQTMGFNIEAPGEGIRISEIVAEQRLEKEGRVLLVDGKMTNMSEHDIPYPPLHVVLKNMQGVPVKEWELDAGTTVLASGETVPVMLQLPDMPQDGAAIEVGVPDR